MNRKPVNYCMPTNIAQKIIFIDGLDSSGKSALSATIPSLDKFEHIQLLYPLEWIVSGLSLGALDFGYAESIVKIAINELTYNNKIGRYSNFRYDDQSGIHKYKDPTVYYKRLSSKDGDIVVEKLLTSEEYIPIQTHDLYVNLDIVFKLNIDFLMIEMMRHPVNIVHSWWKRGWGKRFGADPRAFTLAIEYNKSPMPWYAANFQDKWDQLNEMERCLMIVIELTKRMIKNFQTFKNNEKILIVKHEDFVEKTDASLNKICDFVNTKPTDYTASSLKRANCPRVLNSNDRKEKENRIRSEVSKDLFADLMALSERYERNCYEMDV